MSDHDIETIELSIEEAKKLVQAADSLDKLMSNREFKKIILEGYFKDGAVRCVQAYGDPNLSEYREEIMKDISGIGSLQQYLHKIRMTGNMMRQQIEDLEGEREYILAEDAASDEV